MFENKFDKGDWIALLKILAVIAILLLIFYPLKSNYIETVANISPCKKTNEEWQYVTAFDLDAKIYICGKTNKPSETFELEIYNEKSKTLVYKADITASSEKTIQYHIDYELPEGTYLVKINGPRKTFATTEFLIDKNDP
jgi:hypothetical protein